MRRNVCLKMGGRAMPIWSCLPFPLGGCFQKLHFRDLRKKLEGNSYFLTYSLTLYLKVRSGHLCSMINNLTSFLDLQLFPSIMAFGFILLS